MDKLSALQAANHSAYGRIASLWNETTDRNYDFALHERCRDMFARHLPGRRILEIGCGLGWDSHFFSCAGYDVTATDFQEAFVELAQSRNSKVTGIVMDMLNPFSCFEPFHGIYGFASFLHIPRERSDDVINRLGSLLCKNGILFLHHVRSDKGFTHYTQENLLIENNPVFCSCHSEDEMRTMLVNAGFSSIQFTYLSGRKNSALAGELGLSPYQVLSVKG